MRENTFHLTLHVRVSVKYKQLSLPIGSNDVMRYDVMYFPAICWPKSHFEWSVKLVVGTSINS